MKGKQRRGDERQALVVSRLFYRRGRTVMLGGRFFVVSLTPEPGEEGSHPAEGKGSSLVLRRRLKSSLRG
jgi:hypothetical protein